MLPRGHCAPLAPLRHPVSQPGPHWMRVEAEGEGLRRKTGFASMEAPPELLGE